jgi:hypothetical protein
MRSSPIPAVRLGATGRAAAGLERPTSRRCHRCRVRRIETVRRRRRNTTALTRFSDPPFFSGQVPTATGTYRHRVVIDAMLGSSPTRPGGHLSCREAAVHTGGSSSGRVVQRWHGIHRVVIDTTGRDARLQSGIALGEHFPCGDAAVLTDGSSSGRVVQRSARTASVWSLSRRSRSSGPVPRAPARLTTVVMVAPTRPRFWARSRSGRPGTHSRRGDAVVPIKPAP